MVSQRFRISVLGFALAMMLLAATSATAAVDENVAVDKLALQLAPMDKDELAEAAKEWFEAVKAKAKAVSGAPLVPTMWTWSGAIRTIRRSTGI